MTEDQTKPCPLCGEDIKAVAIKCKHCGERLDRLPSEAEDTLLATGPSPALRYGLAPGTRLGSFVLGEVVGQGGMGSVHRAEHVRLGSQVAIKVLAPHLSRDPALLARFEQEARLQANLRHPNIVPVHDFITEGEVSAFVMELVEGETLERLVAEHRGPLPLARCLELFLPVLDALAFAHERGIVHRDVKPSNVIVATVAGRRVVKVVDFGIARALGGARHTTTGARLGTLYYMSPEQCRGETEVDHRADVYALGVTLFELATGEVPFGGSSEWELLSAHISEPPPRPSALSGGVSAELETVILRALAKDPARRYQNAAEMREALVEVAAAAGIAVGGPVQGTGPAPEPAPPAPLLVAAAPASRGRRRRAAALLFALLVAVVGAGGWAVVRTAGGPESPEPRAPARAAAEPEAPPEPAPPPPELTPPSPGRGAPISPLEASASSSHRSRQGGAGIYAAGRAVDGFLDTWWQEGQPGDGEGESLRVAWQGERLVTEVRLVPGYTKYRDDRFGDRWALNNRLKAVRFTFSTGRSFDRSLEDRRGWHVVPVDPPERATSVEVTILEVYPGHGPDGTRVHDSGISELEVIAAAE